MERIKLPWGLVPAIAASLSACACMSQYVDYAPHREMLQLANSYVGHDYWTANTHYYGVSESLSLPGLIKIGRGKLRFDSVIECDVQCTFHVTFANGISGYIITDTISLKFDVVDHEPPPVVVRTTYPTFLDHLKAKEAERRHSLPGAALGMSKVEVLSTAWGEPDHKTEIRTSTTLKEMWFYPDGNELTFMYGRLAKIKS